MQTGGCPCFLEPGLGAEALLLRARAVGLRRVVLEEESAGLAPALAHAGLRVHLADELQRQSRRSTRTTAASDSSLAAADLAMMQFTSGSTGLPKGALLSHGNLLQHARGIIERTALTAADRLLHVMPLHHTNGVNNQLIAPFLAGASVVLMERFRAEDIEARNRRLPRHLPDRRADDVLACAATSARRRQVRLAPVPPLRLGPHCGAPACRGRSRVRRAADRVVRIVRGDMHVDHEPGRRAPHRDCRHSPARPAGPGSSSPEPGRKPLRAPRARSGSRAPA